MRQLSFIFLLILPLFPVSGSTSAQLILSPAEPVVGQETQIVVRGDLTEPIKIEATYRPSSQVSTREELGSTQQGQLDWRPREVGLVRLQAKSPAGDITVQDITVRPQRPSLSGILILLIAGGLLICGAALGFLRGS